MVDGDDRQMGAKRKKMLFSRREELTQGVVGMTYKCRGQRERGCYSVGQRADMITLRGSAQPKKSESLNQIFSHLHRFILINVLHVCWSLGVSTAYKVKVQKIVIHSG